MVYYTVNLIYKKLGLSLEVNQDLFTEQDAAILFEKYIVDANKQTGKTILLLFYEIENITFDKSAAEHWCSGLDLFTFGRV